MKSLILTTVCILCTEILFAQSPILQAENSFGGTDVDHAFDVHQTTDGGIIMAGHTRSNDADVKGNHGAGTFDMWVVKLTKKGKIAWQRPFGGRLDETAFSIQETHEHGYIVAGQANSNNGQVVGNHGDLDFWILKLDTDGQIIWSRSLGGSKADFATSVKQTKDRGFIICGGSYSNDGEVSGHHGSILAADYWIVKLDSSGNIQWQRSYGGSRSDIAMSVIQSNDGGYVVAGNSASTDGNVTGVHDSIYGDFWIIKLDSKGNMLWQKTYGGSDYEEATDILQTGDGGYISCGWNRSEDGDITGNHGNYDFWVVKINAFGKIMWQKSYGGTQPDLPYSIQSTIDHGYVIAGGTNSNDGDVSGLHGTEDKEDFWVIKIDSAGTLLWQKVLGGSEFEEARGVDQTRDGGYVIAGFSGWDHPNNGDVTGNHGNYDCWVTKLAPDQPGIKNLISNNFVTTGTPGTSIKIRPNPAHTSLTVLINSKSPELSLTIYDPEGHIRIRQTVSQNGIAEITIDVTRLKPGIYYLNVTGEHLNSTTRFFKD